MLTGCKSDPNNTGVEYASQMYHSIPYEPLSQVEGETHPYNQNGIHARYPVNNTIPRQNFSGKPLNEVASEIILYNIPADSIELAATLKNPVPQTEQTLAEGKALYLQFCSACHGENGNGQGKVAAQYQGVPSYKSGRVSQLPAGHIYHTIVYGKGRMWPHGSQMNPQERWKIVHYVQELQKGS